MMPAMSTHPLAEPRLQRVRVLAVAALLGLIALGLVWELWLAPTGNRTLALKVLPLAFALVGILKFRMATYRWVSLLVWVYFAEGVVRATTERGIVVALATLEIGLCLLLFAVCVMHVRWRLQRATVRS
jgi:uncharacterized membrane protein